MNKLELTSGKMEVKLRADAKEKEITGLDLTAKVTDVSKYNLRCNRNVSEKMMHKDFIYDIRRPIQNIKKFGGHKRRPLVLPVQLSRKELPDTKIARYRVIHKNIELAGYGDSFPVYRILNFACNFCREPIATRLSLSTHVKFHRKRYCKKCYWILEEGETMEKHIERVHRIKPGIAMTQSEFSPLS